MSKTADFLRRARGRIGQGRSVSGPAPAISITGDESTTFKTFLAITVGLSLAATCIQNGLPTLFLPAILVVALSLRRSNYARPWFWSERILSIFLIPYVILLSLGVLADEERRYTLPIFFLFFTSGLIFIRVFSPLTDRNISQLLFLTVGIVLVNCILTNHFLFALILPFYLFALMCTLLLFQIARSGTPAIQEAQTDPGNRSQPGWYGNLRRSIIFVLALTIGLFFVLPRPFAAFPGLRAAVAGSGKLGQLQKQITYRDMVSMEDRRRIAFMARLEYGVLPPDSYWRGRVLEKSDGRGWRPARKRRSTGGPVPQDLPTVLRYHIIPFGLVSRHLYVAGLPIWAYGRRRQPLYINAAREVVVDSAFLFNDSYKIIASSRPIPAGGRQDPVHLETIGVTPAIRRLAEQLTRGLSTRRQKADALVAGLRSRIKYKLVTPPPPENVHPLEHFLFKTRSGNCEYFAGALCLLLRTVGVPARVVEGFYGMERTAVPNEFLVRFSRAHAWVEADLGDKVWTILDATPLTRAEIQPETWRSTLADLYDRMEYRWVNAVVNFDRSDQMLLLRDIVRMFRTLSFPRFSLGSRRTIAIIAAALMGLGIVATAILVMLRIRRRRDLPSVYRDTMRDLVRKGILKSVHPWHENNARAILERAPWTRAALTRFMEIYLRARFGKTQNASSKDLQHARQQLLEHVN